MKSDLAPPVLGRQEGERMGEVKEMQGWRKVGSDLCEGGGGGKGGGREDGTRKEMKGKRGKNVCGGIESGKIGWLMSKMRKEKRKAWKKM